MNLWKKALSTALTAMMLASLLATAAATSVFAANGTAFPYTTDVTTKPADGVSFITMTFAAPTVADAQTISVAASGATFINGTGSFATQSFPRTSILLVGAPTTIAAASTLWLASSTAGTATVTISFNSTSLGTLTDSITSFTFTAANTTTVSTAYSKTTVSPSDTAPAVTPTGVTLSTNVNDTNNVAIAAGASVTWTLAGPAYFASTGTFTQTATPVFTAAVVGPPAVPATSIATSSAINSTGVPGVVTITTTVKYLNVTYTLASKTLTLVGTVSKVTVVNNLDSIAVTNTPTVSDVPPGLFGVGNGGLEIAVLDSASQPIGSGAESLLFAVGAYTPAGIFTVDTVTAPSAQWDATDKAYDLDVTCIAVGTATVTIKASTTFLGTTTSVTSDAITFTCANAPSASHIGTLDITASATAVAPNGNVNILVTVKDDGGRPAPDGTVVTAVTNGVGNVVSTKGVLNSAKTSNGTAKFIYLAPANAGSATVTAFVSNVTPTSKAVTIAIGAVLVSGTNGSHLGLSHSGAFTSATKIQTRGHYVTWKLSFGAAAAGQSAGIWVATRKSDGTWGAFVKLTGRTIDSAGNAYFSWRYATAKWISVKGLAGNVGTPARQARWR